MIREMQTGRQMDAEIAHQVFGREILFYHSLRFAERGWVYGDRCYGPDKVIPAYSTDMAAAWGIVEHFLTLGIATELSTWTSWERKYGAIIRPAAGGEAVYAETMPLAICRAALLAKMPYDPLPIR